MSRKARQRANTPEPGGRPSPSPRESPAPPRGVSRTPAQPDVPPLGNPDPAPEPAEGIVLRLPAMLRTPVRLSAAALAVAFGLFFFDAFLPFLIAIGLAYLLRTPMDLLTPRIGTLSAILAVFTALAAVVLLLVVPILANIVAEVASIPDKAMQYRDATVGFVRQVYSGTVPAAGATSEVHLRLFARAQKILNDHPDVQAKLQQFVAQGASAAGTTLLTFARKIGSFFSNVLYMAIVPYLAFYLLLEGPRFRTWYRRRLAGTPSVLDLLDEIDGFLGSFLRGQLTCCFFVGVLLSVGLFFLQVDFAFIIGPVAGFFNLVPYLGPMVAVIPTVVLTILKLGFGWEALTTLALGGIMLSVVQAIDGFLLQPYFIGSSADLHPLELVFALFLGAEVGGFWGMLLAIPAYGTLRIVGSRVRIRFA